MSTRPRPLTVSSITRVQSSGSETSAVTARQRRPSASTSRLVCWRRSVRRAQNGAAGAGGGGPAAQGAAAGGAAEPGGEGRAEPRRGAGDDGDLAVEPETVDDGHGRTVPGANG